MNDSKQNNSSGQPIIISGGGSGVKYAVIGVVTIGGFIVAKKMWEAHRLSQVNKEVADDRHSNIAVQIYSENRSTWTSNSKQIELFRQITDYKKTVKAYEKISGGKSIIEDTRKHVSSSTIQQILNILGIKDGAVEATSQTSMDVQNNFMLYSWVVAKVDSRIRKSPKVESAVFTLRPNIIGVAKGNMIIGIIDKKALFNNKRKLFYDDEHNTFFLPVLIFDSSDARKYYPAFVAIANVNVFKDQPKQAEFYRISSRDYLQANSINGI